LQEGDIILEINGISVHNMPHNNVVGILKDCVVNSSAIFVVQRQPMVMYGHPYGAPVMRPNPNVLPAHYNNPYNQYNENNSKLKVSELTKFFLK